VETKEQSPLKEIVAYGDMRGAAEQVVRKTMTNGYLKKLGLVNISKLFTKPRIQDQGDVR
jgi:hypothetical protein